MKRGKRLLYKKIFAGLLGGSMLLLPSWSYALPSGGNVVTNNGSIATNGSNMNVTGSGNVAIDWNSFNIAANETVNFNNMQAVLNYVSGGNKSEIFGKINGSGVHVFLVNPNGILFGKTAQVNVGQLTASTRSLEKESLNSFNGSMAALAASGAGNVKADIINLGKLTAGKLVLEGNNLSIIGADSLDVTDKSQITLRAKENINIGYEVTVKTTIDVGDGNGSAHQVSDYKDGSGSKASDVLSGSVVTDLTGGSKSINNAMLVHDVYELQAIDKNTGNVNGSNYVVGNYMLAGDIDAEVTKNWNDGKGFDPIGNFNLSGKTGGFAGIFDGAGYSIKSLYIKQVGSAYSGYIGLFDYIAAGSVVSNLNMAGGHIEGVANFGSIAGYNQGTIYNVVNSAELVSKGGGVGGIVGTNGGMIRDTVNNGKLTGDGRMGGIAGYNGDTVWHHAGTLLNVKNTGTISSQGTGDIGGISGINQSNGSIQNAENNGKVETLDGASSGIGGISGRNYGVIEKTKNMGNVIGHIYDTTSMGASKIGGIVGENYAAGIVRDSENIGIISGDNLVGGITGSNAGTLESVQNNGGAVTAKNFSAGGISGVNSGIITNGSNSAAVKAGGSNVGGITGYNKNGGKIDSAINNGSVEGNSFVGGIAGCNDNSEIKNACNNGAVNADINNQGLGLAGGITGYNYNQGSISSSYNTGSVYGKGICVGGIVGLSNGGAISNSYNVGSISGEGYIGGIVGSNGDGNTLTNVYNLGTISGNENVAEIVGDPDVNGTITNAYYKTDAGYKKYDDDTEYGSVADFNKAFLAGMQDSDKASWLTYGDQTTPLLKGLLKSLDINVGDIEVEYTGSDYTGLAQAIADKLAGQGIIIDVSKLLAEGKTEVGEYALSDLLYSLQDGYDITALGKLIIKEKSPEPEPPAEPDLPTADVKYTGSLTHLKTEKIQQEEYRNIDKLRRSSSEQAAVAVDGEGINLE